jgi:hypothetical protein
MGSQRGAGGDDAAVTTGEWAVWAGEAPPAAAAAGVPVWLAIVLAAGGLINTALLGWLGYLLSRRGHKHTVQKGYRDLIVVAAGWTHSSEKASRDQGFAMLEAIAQMKGLSRDDFALVQVLTREVLARRLEETDRAQQAEGRLPGFWRRQRNRGEGTNR